MQRFFEILPGALSWLTLVLMIVFSKYLPTAVSIFIILFDIYWLLKSVYLSLHLRATFKLMKENMETNWLQKLNDLNTDREAASADWKSIYHLIVFPMYKEPYEIVKESFVSLLNSNYPKDKFIMLLAAEERAGKAAAEVARKIEKEFSGQFFKFLVTEHPSDLPGEIPGKGANETWAVKQAQRSLIDTLGINYEKILVSVFDVDTQVFPEYFGCLTHSFLTAKNNLRVIYQPVPFFTNNIFQTPALARVVSFSTTFWQMMQQSRPERLTSFSSQSIPFKTLVDVGFWHTDVVSEDSRIFWQCYLHYHGDFRAEPLFYPVSMDANVAPTFWQTMKNIYKQQRRWAWGCENEPYLLRGLISDSLIPISKKIYWAFNTIEGYHSWATNSLMIFALGWLPVALGGEAFNYTLLSYNLPQITRLIISLSMVGVASSAILSIVLLPPKPFWFTVKHKIIYVLQWILIPITLIIFGAIPALEAQARLMMGGKWRLGFWVTPKFRGIGSGTQSG